MGGRATRGVYAIGKREKRIKCFLLGREMAACRREAASHQQAAARRQGVGAVGDPAGLQAVSDANLLRGHPATLPLTCRRDRLATLLKLRAGVGEQHKANSLQTPPPGGVGERSAWAGGASLPWEHGKSPRQGTASFGVQSKYVPVRSSWATSTIIAVKRTLAMEHFTSVQKRRFRSSRLQPRPRSALNL